MHLRNKRPIFVPFEYQDELEKMSKAALMDLVWDLACGGKDTVDEVIADIRAHATIVLGYRKRDELVF